MCHESVATAGTCSLLLPPGSQGSPGSPCRPASQFSVHSFICSWLFWVFVAARALSLVRVSRGSFLVVVCRILTMGASHVERGLSSTGSIVVVHRLSCSSACRIFPNQGLNPFLLHWQVDCWPLNHQESPRAGVLIHRPLQALGEGCSWM